MQSIGFQLHFYAEVSMNICDISVFFTSLCLQINRWVESCFCTSCFFYPYRWGGGGFHAIYLDLQWKHQCLKIIYVDKTAKLDKLDEKTTIVNALFSLMCYRQNTLVNNWDRNVVTAIVKLDRSV